MRRGLAAFIERHAPDEVILTGQIHDQPARLHSFEIAAEVMAALTEVPAAGLSPAASHVRKVAAPLVAARAAYSQAPGSDHSGQKALFRHDRDPLRRRTAPMPRFAEFVAMMAALMALTALSIDVMLPALPQMRADFGVVDANSQQLVVTELRHGLRHRPALPRAALRHGFGRKPVLLVGLAVYAVASFACFVAGSFEALLVARAACRASPTPRRASSPSR